MSNNEQLPHVESQQTVGSVFDDLLLVSNRQPYRHRYGDDGEVAIDTPAGGLAIGMDPVMQQIAGMWIAWGDGDADFDVADDHGQVKVPPSDPSYTLHRIPLTEDHVRGYYDGYANQALWPLCHSAPGRTNFRTADWEQYRTVNKRFADTIDDNVGEESTVWFQDYHFALAPRFVREQNPDVFQMHFFHIPWPGSNVFRIAPQAETLLKGLLGNDLLMFHSPRYAERFLKSVDQLLDDATIDWRTNTAVYDTHRTHVTSIPFGVNADQIRETAQSDDGNFWRQFQEKHGIHTDTTVAIGVDRLDYTKGIPERLAALERLFETRPDLRGELTYVQKGTITRQRIQDYKQIREQVENSIRDMNERFGTDEWSPIVYTTTMLDRDDLISLYRNSDLALVTPLRDGMNLVAKEYVASQVENDGVLLLSPYAGAHDQLGSAAVEFDPHDTTSAAESLERGIEMDPTEREGRMRRLRRQVHGADISWWIAEVAETAEDVRKARNEPHAREQ